MQKCIAVQLQAPIEGKKINNNKTTPQTQSTLNKPKPNGRE